MTRIAVLDCGTNTFNLLVVDAHPTGWKKVFDNKIPVKLGAGGFAQQHIAPGRYLRGLDALNCHRQNVVNYNCSHVFAYATSALRESDNGTQFTADARQLFNLEIQIIDGLQEAGFILQGVKQCVALGPEPVLVMDIGGGSTEFIIASENEVLWKKSYALGVSRLFEQLQPEGRLTHADVQRTRHILAESLTELHHELTLHQCQTLVGSSGSFDTLYDLCEATREQNKMLPQLQGEHDIPLTTLGSVHHWLMGTTLEERLRHPAIPEIRAEYMPLASLMIKYVLELSPFSRFIHSPYALKEGVLLNQLSTIDWSRYSHTDKGNIDQEDE